MIPKLIKVLAGTTLAVATAVAGLVGSTTTAAAQQPAQGRVIAQPDLTVRWSASIHSSEYRIGVGSQSIPYGTQIPITCKVTGTDVDGNDRWYRAPVGFVSARYVENIGRAPQWCGDGQAYRGRTIAPLTVREGPNTGDAVTGRLGTGTGVDIVCKKDDDTQPIDGNELWYWTTDHNWVAARYVENVGSAPVWCGD